MRRKQNPGFLAARSSRGGRRRRPPALLLGVAAAVGLLAVPASAMAAPAAPALVGSTSNNTTLSGALSVAVAGNYAYTTSYWPGQLTAIDISNPSSPTVAGSTPQTTSLQNGSNITISGTYAFVVSKNRNASTTSNDDGSGNSLTVVDISNPASPTVVGSVHDGSKLFGSYGVAVSGHYAFVAYQGRLSGQPTSPDTSTGGFSVIDLSDLSAGVVANIDNGSLPSPYTGSNALEHATSVAISGSYAYVTAFYSSRVTVIDISNPTQPAIAASLNDSTNLPWPVDVAVQGNDLYVANQSGGTEPQLTILDISNPTDPSVVGTLSDGSLLNNAYRIRVGGTTASGSATFAYLAAKNSSTVAAIDVSDPSSPRLAGYVQDAGHLFSTSGLALDSTGRYLIANSPELSTENGVNGVYPPFTNTTGTISVIDLIPTPIAVAISPTSEPSNPTTQNSASFSFSPSDQVSTVACSLDGAPAGPCSSPTSQTYSSLAPGSHTFKVQTTDAAGDTATASYTWTVNPISVTISSASEPANPTTETSAGFSFSSNEQTATMACSLDGASPGPCSSSSSQSYSSLAPGSHTFTVQASDTSGHSATASYTWTVTAPSSTNSGGGGNSAPATTNAGTPTNSAPATTNTGAPANSAPATPQATFSSAAIRAALAGVLSPRGSAARIESLLRAGGYRFSFAAPTAGRLSLAWYLVPKGASLARSSGRARPTLVATVTSYFSKSGKAYVSLRLTKAGKKLLSGARQVTLTATASFAAPSNSAIAAPLRKFTLRR